MDHVRIDDSKRVTSTRGRIWACDSWAMPKLYAKSQLLQADTLEKNTVPLLKRKSTLVYVGGNVMHLNAM